MKALKQIGYGKLSDHLTILNFKKPKITANEVLIQVHYASLNPHDYKVVLGEFKKTERLSFPAAVGSDFSGTILQVGKQVKNFSVGDEVFGISHGTIAEYCKADTTTICHKPKTVSFEEISTLSVVGMTTIQAFKRIGGIKKDDKILIHAGSGGVGTFAIQYAKSKGAFVYTTTSSDNIEWVKELGADIVIDYKNSNYLDECKDLDIVLDTLGVQYTYDAFKVIKTNGKVVSILPTEITPQVAKELKIPKLVSFFLTLKSSIIKKLAEKKNATYQFVFMQPNFNDLEEISTLIENKKITPIIEKTYDLSDSIIAFEHLEKGHSKGKITIKIFN